MFGNYVIRQRTEKTTNTTLSLATEIGIDCFSKTSLEL